VPHEWQSYTKAPGKALYGELVIDIKFQCKSSSFKDLNQKLPQMGFEIDKSKMYIEEGIFGAK
jgi:hypothetical protein